ncbi:hypothetical protein NSMS1_00550 [Nostoc sp. MS1]|nr:hypothetical protein NSMS1_00550 [Nostoc sp. MS1]
MALLHEVVIYSRKGIQAKTEVEDFIFLLRDSGVFFITIQSFYVFSIFQLISRSNENNQTTNNI